MMTDERTQVFLLLDEAEKRQKTAEQQQAALQKLLQASQPGLRWTRQLPPYRARYNEQWIQPYRAP